MRVLILLASCADKSGALLYVDGKGAITFDRVEFYFGKEIGGAMPTSPKHPLPGPESSLVAKRLFVDADVYSPGGAVGTLSYYVPDRAENEFLGDYVAVLAFSGDQLVGIGELFDFGVTETDGAVYRYSIDLVDARTQDVERWGGANNDCLRWTRDRAGRARTVGVVRDHDTDCDDFGEGDDPDADCLPRVYCDGANKETCEAQVSCVSETGPDSCRVGSYGCSNLVGNTSTCAASVCIDEIACRDCGSGDASTCVVMNNSIHVDAPFVVKPDYTLCAEPFDVDVVLPQGVECASPAIVYVEDFMPMAKFTYKIESVSSTTCRVTIKPEVPGARFTAVPHMMIEIDTPTQIAPRTAFILGLLGTADTACRNPETIMPQLSFGSCIR